MITITHESLEVQLLKPVAHCIRPDFVIDTAHHIEVSDLNERDEDKSIGLLIFDVDNTLEDYVSNTVSIETRNLLGNLRGAGYSLAIALNCSQERGLELTTMFGDLVDVIATPEDARQVMHKKWGKKPTTGMYEYIQQVFGNQFSSAQILMVGDQLLKDVLFGKRAHIRTALTQKFGEHDHPQVERYQRSLERKLVLAMGAPALNGVIEFPQRFTPFDVWAKTKSGLAIPQHIMEDDETKEY